MMQHFCDFRPGKLLFALVLQLGIADSKDSVRPCISEDPNSPLKLFNLGKLEEGRGIRATSGRKLGFK